MSRAAKKFPQLADPQLCSGCSACVCACRSGALRMVVDSEGFERPVFDASACVACGRCTRACPILHRLPRAEVRESWAVQAAAEKVRLASSSGGVFPLLAKEVLSRQGVVFGAAWDDDCRSVCHRAVDREDELHLLVGSKYLQSHIGLAYVDCAEYLRSGRQVLFSGTPCQIAGLRSFLAVDSVATSNLVCVQVVCHGVPSPALWRAHLGEQEKVLGHSIRQVSFRDKTNGWRHYRVAYGEESSAFYGDDWFFNAFLSELCSRPSCFQCSARGFYSGTDLTIGDFWGIDNVQPGYWDDTGLSLVLVHSQTGGNLWNTVKSQCKLRSCTYNQALQGNLSLEQNPRPHSRRNRFIHSVLVDGMVFSVGVARALKPTTMQCVNKTICGFLQTIRRVIGGFCRQVIRLT